MRIAEQVRNILESWQPIHSIILRCRRRGGQLGSAWHRPLQITTAQKEVSSKLCNELLTVGRVGGGKHEI